MKKTLLILIFTTCIIEGCKRFEDGPMISLCSIKSRITGTWNIDKFYIDGKDSTDEYISKLGCEIEFSKDAFQTTDYVRTIYLKNCNDEHLLKGLWVYEHKEKWLHISFEEAQTFPNAIGPFGSNRQDNWTITRLTNREINMSCEKVNYYDGHGYREYSLWLKKI
jgi:hypothetical protein